MSLALIILLNILIFCAATFGTSILIEKYYHGRLKWIIVPSFTLISAILMVKTDFMLKVLSSLTKNTTIQDFGVILLGGILTGIFFSFL
jgi:cellobiose-specific phosphotransferase system component IIB